MMSLNPATSSPFQFNLYKALENTSKSLQKSHPIWTNQDRREILWSCAQWMIEPSMTMLIAQHFKPILEELMFLARSPFDKSNVSSESQFGLSTGFIIRLSSAFSKLCKISPDCMAVTIRHVEHYDVLQPLETLLETTRLEQDIEDQKDQSTLEQILESLRTAWRLLKTGRFDLNQVSLLRALHQCDKMITTESMNAVIPQLKNVYLLASVCLAESVGMSESEIGKISFLKKSYESEYLAAVNEEDNYEYELLVSSSLWQSGLRTENSASFEQLSTCNFTSSVHTANHTSLSAQLSISSKSESSDSLKFMAQGRYLFASDLQCGLVDVAGFLLPSNHSKLQNGIKSNQQLVITPTTSKNLEALALAIGNNKPVVLFGPTGSGKTAIANHIASQLGHDLVTIHIGEAQDGKNLLGGYVATEVPGQFKWLEGSLTRAVSQGQWIVIEDIDLASPEIWGILQPLIQSRQLFIPSRAEMISAHPSFSLFATATTASIVQHPVQSIDQSKEIASSKASLPTIEYSSFWTKVMIDPLSSAELIQVLDLGFGLGQLSPLIVATHELFTSSVQTSGVIIRATERSITTRDTLRWAKRVRHALLKHSSPSNRNDSHQPDMNVDYISPTQTSNTISLVAAGKSISSGIRELAIKEAFDIFLSPAQHISLIENRVNQLGSIWQITSDRIQQLATSRPVLTLSEQTCTIGRSSIPIYTVDKSSTTTPTESISSSSNFVPTTSSLVLLEWLASAVQFNEPILLVGETGGGKTSTIQHLAHRVKKNLVVLNMSQSSDTTDLLGGFKPLDLGMLATPLKKIFEHLFIKTFSKSKNAEFLDRIFAAYAKKDWRTFATLLQKSVSLASNRYEKKNMERQASNSLNTVSNNDTDESIPKPPEAKRQKSVSINSTPLYSNSNTFDGLDHSTFPYAIPIEYQWQVFGVQVAKFGIQVDGVKAFQYIEGALVKAIKRGDWVLLDEINLASAETLECLSGLLEGSSITLNERGDLQPVARHPDFRIFAAMNPANDAGKSNLPPALRARFSEYYLQELENREDLAMIVQGKLSKSILNPPTLKIVDFYLKVRKEAEVTLVDGANQKPRFNLRSLSRAIEFISDTHTLFGPDRAIWEGIQLAFLTQLNEASYKIMEELISSTFRPKGLTDSKLVPPTELQLLKSGLVSQTAPSNINSSSSLDATPKREHVSTTMKQYILETGPQKCFKDPRFIITKTTERHLTHLARALTTRRYPILLQGPTSAGKTSMIEYLAKLTGHRFVRVNNSDQTDLQEYLGQYIHDSQGRLVFHDGVLVEALRYGHWIVLDELNLAPSEVLEALNRLLDDNRQLYIPELQEYVTPHPHFCLFATQNPPGLYGGRKVLSRAFRSRFLEFHMEEIPTNELQIILQQRCTLPKSYCQKLVAIMQELQMRRHATQVFAGRHGYITLRDLFRWADRHPTTYEELGYHGYFLLADRIREKEDRQSIKEVLQKHLKITIDTEKLYEEAWKSAYFGTLSTTADEPQSTTFVGSSGIVWTKATKRLFALMSVCMRHKEPILLVGPPGTGKTALSQLHAELLGQQLEILNCHQNTEAADFIGGLRPVRGKDSIQHKLFSLILESLQLVKLVNAHQVFENALSSLLIDNPSKDELRNQVNAALESNSASAWPASIVDRLATLIASMRKELSERKVSLNEETITIRWRFAKALQKMDEAMENYTLWSSMFVWYDGPLVRSMKRGNCFLVDEISLAEDAVLERLNSVLEPNRLLVLSEKGGPEIEEITAHPDFRILATMNPGGDFGKKELSPALRNRFTEIFVPSVDERQDLIDIVSTRLSRHSNSDVVLLANSIIDFVFWFSTRTNGTWHYTLRDVLAWADFINETSSNTNHILTPFAAYHHGAFMLVIDGLGSTHPMNAEGLKKDALQYLAAQKLQISSSLDLTLHLSNLNIKCTMPQDDVTASMLWRTQHQFGLGTFSVPIAPSDLSENIHNSYSMESPTTLSNLQRLLRSLQLRKPILLEGSPGVGKTTLVEALGMACHRKVVRINLSEQTDMLDLLGADLPVEDDLSKLVDHTERTTGSNAAKFEWRDGVFLNALKNGDWVLLDELNLANQSVLEGLNAVLDHRGTVFIPELNSSFTCPPSFRIFAAQNPTSQGGGRKGLPKSFLNRFTKVFLGDFSKQDLSFIASSLYPNLDKKMINQMIEYNMEIHRATMVDYEFGRDGSPWEFNLRDILRWLKLVSHSATPHLPDPFVRLLYLSRFRKQEDVDKASTLYAKCFGRFPPKFQPFLNFTPNFLQVGNCIIHRESMPQIAINFDQSRFIYQNLMILDHDLPYLGDLMTCIQNNWLSILVGPSASGKTSLIHLLARLTGNVLNTFNVNPSVDTLEILGGFEQIDLNRHSKVFIQNVSVLVSHIVRSMLHASSHFANSKNPGLSVFIDDARHFLSMWNRFLAKFDPIHHHQPSEQFQSASDGTSDNTIIDYAEAMNILTLADDIIEKIQNSNTDGLSIAYKQQIESIGIILPSKLKLELLKLQSLEKKQTSGSFEWVDGLLIEAIENGHWIVLENVNTCPGPVLDRLLPLLEPNGTLRMNERGLVNGQVVELKPHPNFRIFFTMDPKYGEISRAMRNRGIEIGIFPIQVDNFSQDVERLLKSRLQIASPVLYNELISFHLYLSCPKFRQHQPHSQHSEKQVPIDTSLGLADLLRWADLAAAQLQRGFSLSHSLSMAMEQVYSRGQASPYLRNIIRGHFNRRFANLNLEAFDEQSCLQLIQSPGFDFLSTWPHSIRWNLVESSKLFRKELAELMKVGETASSSLATCLDSRDYLLIYSILHFWRNCTLPSHKSWKSGISAYLDARTHLMEHKLHSLLAVKCPPLSGVVQFIASTFFPHLFSDDNSPVANQPIQFMNILLNAAYSELSLLLQSKFSSSEQSLQNLHSIQIELGNYTPLDSDLWKILTEMVATGDQSYSGFIHFTTILQYFQELLPQVLLDNLVDWELNDIASPHELEHKSIVHQVLAKHRSTTHSTATAPISTAVSLFFNAFDSMLNQWMIGPLEEISTLGFRQGLLYHISNLQCQSGTPNKQHSVQLELTSLLRIRHHLYRYLLERPAAKLDMKVFVTLFHWLIRTLEQFMLQASSIHYELRYTQVFSTIKAHIEEEIKESMGTSSRSILWKSEGHSAAFKHPKLISIASILYNSANSHTENLELTEMIAKGIATLNWLNTLSYPTLDSVFPHEQEDNVPVSSFQGIHILKRKRGMKENLQQLKAITDSFLQLPASLESLMKKLSSVRKTDNLDSIDLVGAGSSMEIVQEQAKSKLPVITPLFDYMVLQSSKQVLYTLELVLLKMCIDPTSNLVRLVHNDVKPFVQQIDSIISISTSSTKHSIRLISAFQTLQWIIDAQYSASSIFKMDIETLKLITGEIKSALLERISTNSIGDVDFKPDGSEKIASKEGVLLPKVVLEYRRKAAMQQMTAKELADLNSNFLTTSDKHVGEGPINFTFPSIQYSSNEANYSRLESSFRISYLMSRLEEWKSVPVFLRHVRFEEMKQILSTVINNDNTFNKSDRTPEATKDWISLIGSLIFVIASFVSKDMNSSISSDISLLYKYLISLVKGQPIAHVLSADNIISIFHNIHNQTSDERFKSRGERYLAAIRNTVLAFCQYSQEYWNKVWAQHAAGSILYNFQVKLAEEPIVRFWKGQILIQLSVLRSVLLLPSRPIDSAAKHTSKAALIGKIEEQSLSLQQVLSMAHLTSEKDREAALLDWFYQVYDSTLEKHVCRPKDAPPFNLVFRALISSFESHCDISKLEDFINCFSLVSLVHLNANFLNPTISIPSHIPKHTLISTQLPMLLSRESQLQNNIQQSITQLQTRFGASYPDVVNPFINCLFELKRGLRMIRTSCELIIPSKYLNAFTDADSISKSSIGSEGMIQTPPPFVDTSIDLNASSLSCSSDSLYSHCSHLQMVVSKLIQIPSNTLSSSHRSPSDWIHHSNLAVILSSTTFDAITALARLAQARNQGLIENSGLSQDLTRASALEGKMKQWMMAAGRTNEVLKIQAALLRSCLYAVHDMAKTQGHITKTVCDTLDRIFIVFVETFRTAKAEEEKQKAAQAEFYKYKDKDVTIEKAHDIHEHNFKSLFPNYYSDFEDIVGPDKSVPLDPHADSFDIDRHLGIDTNVMAIDSRHDEDDDDIDDEGLDAHRRRQREKEKREMTPAMIFQGKIYQLSDPDIYQLCRVHFKIFSVLRTFLQPGVLDIVDAEEFDEIDELEPIPANLSSSNSWNRKHQERIHAFMGAYETASKLVNILGENMTSSTMDAELDNSHIISIQHWMHSLTAYWRKKSYSAQESLIDKDGTSKASTHVGGGSTVLEKMRSRGKAKKLSRQKRLADRQRRLEASQAAVVTSYMNAHDLIPNFYTQPNAGEASLLFEPLTQFQRRLEHLLSLDEIGENQVLITIWKLVTRLLESDAHLPLMHFVTGLELVIDKSEEWELYQPAKFSIRTHMDDCARLVTRWRSMELEFWPNLLTTKEQEHQLQAAKWWFHLYSLLHSYVESSPNKIDPTSSNHKNKAISLSDVLQSIQEFLEFSSYGQFPTRLHLIVAFYYQLLAIQSLDHSTDRAVKSRRQDLLTLLYNLYRYYAQFLNLLQAEMFKLKEAIQTKLDEFIKISKWDDSSYFRLRKTTEATHKQLGKMSRQYETEVLSLPFTTILALASSQDSQINSLLHADKKVLSSLVTSKSSADSASGVPTSSLDLCFVQPLKMLRSRTNQLIYYAANNHFTTCSIQNHVLWNQIHFSTGATIIQNVESFFAKMSKHARTVILPTHLGFAHRSHIQLERVSIELIDGMQEMKQKEGKGDTLVKKRAFTTLLSELASLGLDFHTTAVRDVLKQTRRMTNTHHNTENQESSEVESAGVIQDLTYLLLEPIVEPIISKILLITSEEESKSNMEKIKAVKEFNTKKKKRQQFGSQNGQPEDKPLTEAIEKFWTRSDDYFYRVLSKIIVLRGCKNAHSDQLSRTEASRSFGFAEHMFVMLIHLRRSFSLALQHHQSIEQVSTSLEQLFAEAITQTDSDSSEQPLQALLSIPPQNDVKSQLIAQKQYIDTLLSLLYSIHDLVAAAYSSISIASTQPQDDLGFQVDMKVSFEKTTKIALNQASSTFKSSIIELKKLASRLELQLAVHTDGPLDAFSESLRGESNGNRSGNLTESLLIGFNACNLTNDIDSQVSAILSSIKQSLALCDFTQRFLIDIENVELIKPQARDWSQSVQVHELSPTLQQDPFVQEFTSLLNSTVESILLSVQKVYKLLKARNAQEETLIAERKKEAAEHQAAFERLKAESIEHSIQRKKRLGVPLESSDAMDVDADAEAENEVQEELTVTLEDQLKSNRLKKNVQQHGVSLELEEDDRFLPLDIPDALSHMDQVTVALSAPVILDRVSSVCSMISKYANKVHTIQDPASKQVLDLCLRMLFLSYPTIKQWSNLHLGHIHSRSLVIKSASKFAYILISVLTTIMKDGFCIPPPNKDDGEQGDTIHDVEGTGLGEGQGDKDVTDQYDNEEQLLGEKQKDNLVKEDLEEEDANKPPVDPDTGAEMEEDFEGEMRDVERKEPSQDQDEDSEQDLGELMDREMGDLNSEDEEVLDERLWESGDEDDDGNNDKDGQKGKDRYEKNAPLQNNDKDEKEMEARLDDESFKPPENQENDGKDDATKKNDKQQQKKDEQQGDDGGDASEGSDDEGDQDGGDASNDKDPIKNQDDDVYEDSHHKQPHKEEEQFELPEDMNLDAGDQNQDQAEEGAHEDDGESGDEEMDVDDSMTPFPEQKEEQQQQETDENPAAEDQPNKDDTKADDDGDEPNDFQGTSMGVDEVKNASDSEEEGDNEDGDEEDSDRELTTQAREDDKDYSQAYGIHDDKNRPQQQNVKSATQQKKQSGGGGQEADQAEVAQNQDTDQQDDGQGAQKSSSNSHSSKSQRNQTHKQSSIQSDKDRNSDETDLEGAKKEDQEAARKKRQKSLNSNPLRNLGDAMKHWQKDLNVLDDKEDGNEDDQPGSMPNDDDEKTADPDNLFEFSRKNEQHDDQTMGIADEEQAEQFQNEEHKEAMMEKLKEEAKGPQDRNDDLDDPNAMDIDEEQNQEDDQHKNQNQKSVQQKSQAPPDKLQMQKHQQNQQQKKSKKSGSDSDMLKDEIQQEIQYSSEDQMDIEKPIDFVVSKGFEEKTENQGDDKDEEAQDEQSSGNERKNSEPESPEKELTPEDLIEMRVSMEIMLQQWRSNPENVQVGAEIWRTLQSLTSSSAQQLCEQLRLILEPTLKSKMQGDYRTGKRLNMRRVVTYVASQYRKDKIWLRRTMPNKRTYQVLLCLDDSQSVVLGNAAQLMREATATLCIALQRLAVGQISLIKFGQQVDLLHSFTTPFTDESASVIMPQLTFEQSTTNMELLMRTSVQIMELARHESSLSSSGGGDTLQLMFIIGDGRFGDKREELTQWLHRAQQHRIFVVFLIMDTLDKDQSILDIQSVLPTSSGITITPYLTEFPFSYYIILRHLDNLPHILADALRQWFELVNQKDR